MTTGTLKVRMSVRLDRNKTGRGVLYINLIPSSSFFTLWSIFHKDNVTNERFSFPGPSQCSQVTTKQELVMTLVVVVN